MNEATAKLDAQVENVMDDAELEALLAMEQEEVVEETASTESEQPEIEVLHVHSETDAAETEAASPKNVGKKPKAAAKPKRVSTKGMTNSEAIKSILGADYADFLVFRNSEAKLTDSERATLAEKRLTEFDEVKHVKMAKKCLNVFEWMKTGRSMTTFVKLGLDALISKGTLSTKDLKQVYLDRPYQDKTASSVSSQMARVLCIFGVADRDTDGKLVLSDDSSIAALYKSRS